MGTILKYSIAILFTLGFNLKSVGQIQFEKGYFVDSKNKRYDCLIKNLDWKSNPKEIIIKHNEASEATKIGIDSISEFGINGINKFISSNVLIDRSPNETSRLTYDRNPIWSEEKIFLKVLLEGKATLYKYEQGNLLRFFYSTDSSEIQQLVYKRYLATESDSKTSEKESIKQNNSFRQQLWMNVRCPNTSLNAVEYISYTQNGLVKYFRDYLFCHDSPVNEIKSSKKQRFFNLKIAPGIDYSSLSLSNGVQNNGSIKFDNCTSMRLGIETEFLLPYNKNKWGLLVEPAYQSIVSQKKYPEGNYIASIDLKYISIPLGLRYYMFLNEKYKIFVNALVVPNYYFDIESQLIAKYNKEMTISPSLGFAGGAGFELGRLSSEFRFYSKIDLLNEYTFWSGDYEKISIILGYKIINAKSKKQ